MMVTPCGQHPVYCTARVGITVLSLFRCALWQRERPSRKGYITAYARLSRWHRCCMTLTHTHLSDTVGGACWDQVAEHNDDATPAP